METERVINPPPENISTIPLFNATMQNTGLKDFERLFKNALFSYAVNQDLFPSPPPAPLSPSPR